MHRAAIFLGVALTLGVLPKYSVGQTPSSSAANSTAAAQSPPESSAGAENPPRSDKPTENHDRKWHLKLGAVSVGAGYTHFSSPFYYPYGLYPFDGFYRTWLWDPYWANPLSYPSGYFGYNDGRGEVKLILEPKTVDLKLAEVYVDNAYAGTVDHLKNMWLEPGAYDLSVSSKDHVPFHRRIYVLSGRSLKIAAKLNPQKMVEAPEAKP
jgi:hypothetical protein